jgi:protein-L-isoaspartate(D-aspartate) O-methyltransferase
MTQLLDPDQGDTVLEIGTGSGYQAAILSPLVGKVCTIEIIPELGQTAATVLQAGDFGNVEAKVADGYYGWPECGPFDGIVVTAAIEHVPPPLVEQLAPGGRMVIPVGGPFSLQMLTVVEKSETGEVSTRQLMPVRFVPFTRAE